MSHVQVSSDAPVLDWQASLCQGNPAPNTFTGKQNLHAVTNDPGVNNMKLQMNALAPSNRSFENWKINYGGILERLWCHTEASHKAGQQDPLGV